MKYNRVLFLKEKRNVISAGRGTQNNNQMRHFPVFVCHLGFSECTGAVLAAKLGY